MRAKTALRRSGCLAVLFVVHAALVLGCGARTGLEVPRVGMDAGVPDVTIALDVRPDIRDSPGDARDVPVDGFECPSSVVLFAARAEVVLVLDRSGSMSRPLGGSGVLRWAALRAGLSAALPAFDGVLQVGTLFYPVPPLGGPAVCLTPPGLDLAVGDGNTASVLRVFDATGPEGGTPTAAALDLAGAALAPRAGLGVSQAIVLATDGSPNCNPEDAGQPWYGIGYESCADAGFDPLLCIDDVATVAVIDRLRERGVPTYVIGMDVRDRLLVDVLSRMARAGGRARTTGTPYYDVEAPADLSAAFAEVADRVLRCSFVASTPIDPDAGVLSVGGTVVRRDDGSGDGYAVGAGGTIELRGTSCEAARGGAPVTFEPRC